MLQQYCTTQYRIAYSKYFDFTFINFHPLFIKLSKLPSLSHYLIVGSPWYLHRLWSMLQQDCTVLMKIAYSEFLILLSSILVHYSSSWQNCPPCLTFYNIIVRFPWYIHRLYYMLQQDCASFSKSHISSILILFLSISVHYSSSWQNYPPCLFPSV